jgi:TatD DNase family protein
MSWIDTHSHLYLDAFDFDRDNCIHRAFQNNVEIILLPNIDNISFKKMLNLASQFPDKIFPMIGIHPCYVGEHWEQDLQLLKKQYSPQTFKAVGEIGIDLHWDTSTLEIQKMAFRAQIQWAKEWDLPIVIHSRASTSVIIDIIEEEMDPRLFGVFHCFSGTKEDADRIMHLQQFMLGIGGNITYKNSSLSSWLKEIPLSKIVLETDSPYLPPVPYRGKRNESSYLPLIGQFLSEIYEVPIELVKSVTTQNAKEIFKLN